MKYPILPIAAFICYAMTGAVSVYANDVVINVSHEDSEVQVRDETSSPLENDEYMREKHLDPIGRKNKQEKKVDSEPSWFGKLFGEEETKPVSPTLDSDEQNILLNKEFLDPDEHIIKSKKLWEQSLLKKKPNLIVEPYVFFNAKPGSALSSRMYIDERSGKIYFLVKQGSLKHNVNALMKDTRNTKHLIWKVGNHKVFSEYWVSGESMFEVVNNLLSPYKQPDQVMFGVFLGNTIGIFYRGDKEFWL